MYEILSAVPLANHKLLLTFENMEKKIFDMSNELTGVFEQLKDSRNFNAVKIVHGAPTWLLPNELEIDLCPDTLYIISTPFEEVTA